MKTKNLLIIAGVIVAILIAGLIYLYLQNNKVEPVVENQKNTTENNVVNPNEITNSNTVTEKAAILNNEELDKQAVLSQAMNFGEIVSSYSNHDNYQSLAKLNNIITPEVQTKLASWIAGMQKQHSISDDYIGASGQVISKTIKDFNFMEGTATVSLKIQQQLQNPTDSKTAYIDIEVGLKKIDSEWKISEFGSFDKI
ncbi:MAG: hypothetical protein WCX88_01135 [Patescibacteria group bacterium]